MEISVVVDDGDRPHLEPRLAEVASTTSELVPSVQPQISILSPQQWDFQRDGETIAAHHNPESTEAMGRGVDTRDDGQGKANGASPIPIDGDEGGVR